jgi:hypothetical protein
VSKLLLPALLAVISLTLFAPAALAHEGHPHGGADCHGEGEDFHCHLEDGTVLTGDEARAFAAEMGHGDHEDAHDHEAEELPDSGGPAILPMVAVLMMLGVLIGLAWRRS